MITRPEGDLPLGDIRSTWIGAVKISTDGEATVRGKATTIAVFAPAGEVERILFEGSTSATIEHGISLSSLSLAELQDAAQWLDVETSAQTKSGLKRAIERHLE